MGMTIDEAIEHGKDQLEIFGGKHKEFIEIAVNTLRKYKKIAEIVSAWKVDTWTDGASYDCMVQISEMIEDGNDD